MTTLVPPARLDAEWEPPAPQLIRNARMTSFAYQADPEKLGVLLPPGLRPHPNNRVHLNMYEAGEGQTSGFGPFSITYLAIEVADHDSDLAEGVGKLPGRYFAFYWNSSARVRAYVRASVGVKAVLGERRVEQKDGRLVSILKTGGRDVIHATVKATNKSSGTVGGHLNYYSRRTFVRPDGGQSVLDDLLEFPLPFLADSYEASVEDIVFDFPDDHPAFLLQPIRASETAEVLYADATFTYSMGRVIQNYLKVEE